MLIYHNTEYDIEDVVDDDDDKIIPQDVRLQRGRDVQFSPHSPRALAGPASRGQRGEKPGLEDRQGRTLDLPMVISMIFLGRYIIF